ncbi:MAG: serine/threonine protein kinase [Deltaproteobacteria bacterium]|nr:serine/threonine protein kinase [Deltaproteobacteria bacterium]
MKGSKNTELPKLEPGAPSSPVRFGDYYFLGLIARGGMAEVYRARKIEPEGEPELLAFKVMRPSIAKERRFIEMFHSEGQLAMLLVNQSIVRTVDLGRIEGRHYIAMEYLSGQDLTQVLRRCQERGKRLPIPHAVYIASRIVEGLDFAHRCTGTDGRPLNIVNRDVSPSNVRVTYDGEAKVLDFGIAQALMKFTSEIGILKGKFSYMSPEQIRGMPLDARSDLFSAGIILHEMLTTEKLFRGDTEFALMEKVRKAEIPKPSSYNRKVTDRLDEITMRALARNVGERYQTAGDMLKDLREVLDGYGFDKRELQQLLKQLFRAEYVKEQRNCQVALTSLPPVEGDDDDDDPDTHREPAEQAAKRAVYLHESRVGYDDEEPELEISTADQDVPPTTLPPDPEASSNEAQQEGGFWARFRRKRKR